MRYNSRFTAVLCFFSCGLVVLNATPPDFGDSVSLDSLTLVGRGMHVDPAAPDRCATDVSNYIRM
jgi:hypothetical protein